MYKSINFPIKLLMFLTFFVSINTQSMDETSRNKASFERSKKQALWKMGGIAAGALSLGSIALFSLKKDCCCRSIEGGNSATWLSRSKSMIIAGSGVTGALIGACASSVGSGNKEYDKKKKKEIALWRIGGALAGGAIFLTAASIVTNGMVGQFQ